VKVASFYRFLDLGDVRTFREELQALCEQQRVLGTILVAAEGFNGTIAGAEEAILAVFGWIEQRLSLDHPVEARWTDSGEAPFRRMRVRAKKEIVTLGRPDILPHEGTGEHVPPEKWNALIEDPEVLVIDTRNHYEVEVGTFPRGDRQLSRVSRVREEAGRDVERPAVGHVLHGRYPLRESNCVNARTGF
jgi:UPF0176 protein